MRVTILAVGKIKERYLEEGIREYTKRLGPYCRLEIKEVNDEKAPEGLSAAMEKGILEKEGRRLLKLLDESSYLIGLVLKGEQMPSEAFADMIRDLGIKGISHITFVIGGSLGLSKEVLDSCSKLLSFSQMTFPHQLMRLTLLEQVYRGFKIMKGEPYHK